MDIPMLPLQPLSSAWTYTVEWGELYYSSFARLLRVAKIKLRNIMLAYENRTPDVTLPKLKHLRT